MKIDEQNSTPVTRTE